MEVFFLLLPAQLLVRALHLKQLLLIQYKVVSGSLSFSLLSEEEQSFALNTVVQYAPRPYEWIRNCKATSDGLTIAHAGNEVPLDELAPWKIEHVQSHPVSILFSSHYRS